VNDSSPVVGAGSAPSLSVRLVVLASLAVLAAALLASFRLGFADDLPTLVRVNGPHVLFAAACGGLLALSGSLRLRRGTVTPLFELALFAGATAAAGGGFLAAGGRTGTAALVVFPIGAGLSALAAVGLVRFLDQPRRWTNLVVALLLGAGITVAALTGTYARARRDAVSELVTWLLGDLTGSSFASGGALLVVLAALVVAAFRTRSAGAAGNIALVAAAAAVGAAGPLAFVGTFVPRTVRALARNASARAVTLASVAAGAATVAAVDAVPRLLVGGYDFPFAVPVGMVAIPAFLGWNRARLRREAGRAGVAFEVAEVALIVALTLGSVFVARTLALVIRAAT
jgi:iron complex transport system permease protein